jgi:probable rRNA maturation factor
MKIDLEVNNKTGCSLEGIQLQDVIEKTLRMSGQEEFLKDKTVEISIGFISEDEIKKINSEYRSIEKPTDVLSFPNYANLEELQDDSRENLFLGEILVCCEDIKKYAKIKNSFFGWELIYVISHGVLHLLGMEHGKEMFLVQEKVAQELA